jgi:hypothetical protein
LVPPNFPPREIFPRSDTRAHKDSTRIPLFISSFPWAMRFEAWHF